MAELATTPRPSLAAADKIRLPPHSVEAEQSLLGGLMLDQRAWDQIADVVHVDDLYRADHRLIFSAIAELVQRNQPPDAVTVGEHLQRTGQLEAAGGLPYLARLVEDTPSAANIRAYARIVRERAMLRHLIEIGGDIAASAHSTQGLTVEEIVDLAEQRVFEIAEGGRRGPGFTSLKEILPKTIDRLDTLSHSASDITGVSTGFTELDKMTSGLQRGELIIIAGRPSMGKCIVSGSRVLDPITGALQTIDSRVLRRHGDVASLDSRGRLQAAKATTFVDDGFKPVYEVRTALGRRIAVTASHPFLTLGGWRRLADLQADMHIGVPRALPFFGNRPLDDSLVKLVAYFLTDGGLTASVPKFTNEDARIRDDFTESVNHFPGMRCRTESGHGRTPTVCVVRDFAAIRSARRAFGSRLREFLHDRGWSLTALADAVGVTVSAVHWWVNETAAPSAALTMRLSSVGFDPGVPPGGVSFRKNAKNPIAAWLDTLGLWGKSAHDKRVPDMIFELPRRQLALFLNRAFACDGSIYVQNGDQVGISYSTVSEQLARDVQHLLLRFGIVAKLRSRQMLYRGTRRPAYELRVLRQEDIARFVNDIGLFGKEAAAAKALAVSLSKRPKVNADVIPVDVWALIEAKKGARTWAEIARGLGHAKRKGANLHVGKRGLSRPRLQRIADVLDDEELRNLAASDIYWDRIVAIEPVGERQVYDLTVPEHHNFVAEDIVVHNTTLAINIAENAAIGAQVPAGIFSMEMSAEQLSFRMLSSVGRVSQTRLRNGKLTEEDWPRVHSAVSMMSSAPIFIDDGAALTPTEVRSRARRLKREHGLGLIVVDYLQLMQVSGNVENRATELSEISRSLKALAKELEVPVIALSQLNRSVEQRNDKKPVMSDLRESGALEQDADLIVFIYREEVYDRDTPRKGIADIIIGKQRNGPVGEFRLTFLGEFTRFENLVDEAYGEGVF